MFRGALSPPGMGTSWVPAGGELELQEHPSSLGGMWSRLLCVHDKGKVISSAQTCLQQPPRLLCTPRVFTESHNG